MQFFNLHTHRYTNNSDVIELVNQYPWQFEKNIPHYQFSSKEIPITGTFTGYPKRIMIEWLKQEIFSTFSLNDSVTITVATWRN